MNVYFLGGGSPYILKRKFNFAKTNQYKDSYYETFILSIYFTGNHVVRDDDSAIML